MSTDDHIDAILNHKSDEEEFADEMKAFEEEEARQAKQGDGDDGEEEPEAGKKANAKASEGDEEGIEGEGDGEGDGEGEGDDGQQAPQSKQVDLRALQAVRAENQQLRNQMNQMGMMMQQLQQSMQQPQQPQGQPRQGQLPPPPDPNDDPMGAMEWLIANQQQQMQQAQQMQQQQQQAQQQAAVMAQVHSTYVNAANQFAEATPDFNDAYNYLVNSRLQELMATGVPQDKAIESLRREEMGLAYSSIQQGVNPAQRIYEMAKFRGYRKNTQAARQPNKMTAEQQAAAERAKAAAATNTNRSKPPATEMTWERVAELEGAAFDKAFEAMMKKEGLSDRRPV